MRRVWMTVLLTALATSVARAEVDLAVEAWREEFKTVEGWTAQPTWLSNPFLRIRRTGTAKVSTDGGVACFAVDEPGKGMKWYHSIHDIWLPGARFLVMRYRAEHDRTDSDDYAVFLDDRSSHECHAFRFRDLAADGQWRTIAVDALRLAQGESVGGVAVQVQTTAEGKGRLWIDFMEFTPSLPPGALEIQRGPAIAAPAKPDWVADLAKAEWQFHKDWLGNPADHFGMTRADSGLLFRVDDPNQGMKWSWDLPAPAETEGHRYLVMRYRAQNTRPVSDYTLAVIGTPRGKGLDYACAIPPTTLTHDGRWHVAAIDLGKIAAQFKSVGALALQVQAGNKTPAEISVSQIAFANQSPAPLLSDFIDVTNGAGFDEFASVDLTSVCNDSFARFLEVAGLKGWPEDELLTAQGIPFRLVRGAHNAVCSGMSATGELSIPTDSATSEVYLLMTALFRGRDDPVRGEGPLHSLTDVDRFRVRLVYTDGASEECLPLNVARHAFEVSAGPQVLCAFANPKKRLKSVQVCDATPQGAFAVAGVTCRVQGRSSLAEFREESAALAPTSIRRATAASPKARLENGKFLLENGDCSVTFQLEPPTITGIYHKTTHHHLRFGSAASPLCSLKVAGRELPSSDLHLVGEPSIAGDHSERKVALEYRVASAPGLVLTIDVTLGSMREMGINLSVANNGDAPVELGLVGPRVGPFLLGQRSEDDYYLFPQRGSVFNNETTVLKNRYCGLFPVQFVSVTSPAAGDGVYLRTEDSERAIQEYVLAKTQEGETLSVEYPSLPLPPGQKRTAAMTRIGVASGDWHDGFTAYRDWVKTWYKPASSRKQWFREVFNFRQRFLHGLDPLYDGTAGAFQLQRALTEGAEKFGGIDYLHLFDWGDCGPYGRIYGRTGDYSPYDHLKGGKDAFRQAIAEIQRQGVPVGLYIEGYLLEEKGKLGQAHGKEWQLISSDGKGMYWPQSTEMDICSWVPAWRDVQASTYATKVSELNVSGMYLDEYGFAGPWMDCYSKTHGHPVPGITALGERGCTKMVREAISRVKSNAALYSEESPCDVNSQFQDGSFTYAMCQTSGTRTQVPLNVFRFAIPSFKTFEILYCDKPTGSWATGVKWVFFNGEGLWLEGPADEWFAPQTLAAIRKCHAILRRHKDAFTSNEPVPLVPTEMGAVFANLFPTPAKKVFTLYNSRHRTVTGPILRVPHVAGATWRDAWNDKAALVKRDGAFDIVTTTIGPLDVGCLVQESGRAQPVER